MARAIHTRTPEGMNHRSGSAFITAAARSGSTAPEIAGKRRAQTPASHNHK
jgi:hypothetical protein